MDPRTLNQRYSTGAIVEWIGSLREPPRRREGLPYLTEEERATLDRLRSFQRQLLVDIAPSAKYVVGDREVRRSTDFRRARHPLPADVVRKRFMSEMREQVTLAALPLEGVLPGDEARRRILRLRSEVSSAERTRRANPADAIADELFLSFLAWLADRGDKPWFGEYYWKAEDDFFVSSLGEPIWPYLPWPAPKVIFGVVLGAFVVGSGGSMEGIAVQPAVRALEDLLWGEGIAVTQEWVASLVFAGGSFR
jgi:hypothetical protein